MTRVAYLDTSCHPHKPGTSSLSDLVWEMAEAAARQGLGATIYGLYAAPFTPPANVTVVSRPPTPFWHFRVLGQLATTLRLWSILRSNREIDVLHAPEPVSPGILAPFVRWPVVCTVSGNIYDRIANGNPFDPLTTLSFKAYTHSTARCSAMVIAISAVMERWWRQCGTPPERLRRIPLGVDTERFRRIDLAPERLGFDPAVCNVLYVGRLSAEKGIWDLLEALRQLRDRAIRLHLCGRGPLHTPIAQFIAAHQLGDMVRLHGGVPRHDLPAWYSAADLTVLPSYTEGMPRAMIEAMACGSAFLGTRISGIEDHVLPGETGFIVEPHQPAALAQVISDVSDDRAGARAVAQRGCDYVRSTLAWPLVMQRIIDEVYAPLVASRQTTWSYE